jgi:hypothetical protein
MNKMELYTYYNLDECRSIIVKRLESYKDEGENTPNGDILKLTDIDFRR